MSSVNLIPWLETLENEELERLGIEKHGSDETRTKKRRPIRNGRQTVSLKTEEIKWQKLKHQKW